MARRINLIPRSERPRTRTDWGLLATVGLFIIVIFALGFGYYTFSNVLEQRKQELADLEVQTAALEQQVAALQQYEQLANQRENIQAVVQSIYANRTLLSQTCSTAVSLVVPENAWFQSLDLTAPDPVYGCCGRHEHSTRQYQHRGCDIQLRRRVSAHRPPATDPVAHRRPVDIGQRDPKSGRHATRRQRLLDRRCRRQQGAGRCTAVDRRGGSGAMTRKMRMLLSAVALVAIIAMAWFFLIIPAPRGHRRRQNVDRRRGYQALSGAGEARPGRDHPCRRQEEPGSASGAGQDGAASQPGPELAGADPGSGRPVRHRLHIHGAGRSD